MFVRRSLAVLSLASVLLVVIIGGLASLAARRDGHDVQPPPRESLTTGPTRATSRFRNLSLQPEAAKLSKRLGQRFIGSESGASILIGEVTTGDTRVPVRMVRQQDERGESIEISVNGRGLLWNASHGARGDTSVTEFDRSLVERLVFDSADAFVLAQLRGASYQVLGKNVRADLGGADNYTGPLWTVVRVSYEGADSEAKPESIARVFYIDSRTGLVDKVISEVGADGVEATFGGWMTQDGETFPSLIRWSVSGHQVMEFKIITFDRPSSR